MTFLELEKQYQAYKEELSETLNTLGAMCSNFTEDNPEYFEGIDYVNNPYELGYNETYQEHWIDLEDNSITVHFSYEDSYDEICDSDSQIKYPLHWVEAVFEGSESSLGAIQYEIKDNILKHSNVEITRAKREVIYEALRYDLITKEFAEEALAELI
jgi:hypothetical protein